MTAEHADQLRRIRQKLKLADKADGNRAVFRSTAHQYRLGPPVPEHDVAAFESSTNISLPEDYRAFLTTVGNGPGHAPTRNPIRAWRQRWKIPKGRAGAGPYYGISPFGRANKKLDQPSIVDLEGKNTAWKKIVEECDALGDDDEVGFDTLEERYLQGIVRLGEQGCGAYFALVITGEARGRVVYLSESFHDEGCPFLCYEANFLDWYERWLDEVIAGDLQQSSAAWFGMRPGGSAETLLQRFLDAQEEHEKFDLLYGLMFKRVLPAPVIEMLLRLHADADGELREAMLRILAKHDFNRISDDLLSGRYAPLIVMQIMHGTAKDRSIEALPLIKQSLAEQPDPETFRFCCYLLKEIGDRAIADDLLTPYLDAENSDIRNTVRYILAELNLPTKGLLDT